MKISLHSIKVAFALLIVMLPLGIFAQKLPNVQKESLWAPANIKIDGRATEWVNMFKARNKATDLYYTMSNNDKHLYLVMQAKEPEVINKIFAGGITLTIQASGKKAEKGGISITYPITNQKGGIMFPLFNGKGQISDSSAKAADSTMRHNNNTIQTQCKFIKVVGVKDVDTLISVYNHYGISSAGLFNNKKIYTLEMDIPLKYLGISANAQKFSYHVRINGKSFEGARIMFVSLDGSEMTASRQAAMIQTLSARFAPTDFWGEYTLAKK